MSTLQKMRGAVFPALLTLACVWGAAETGVLRVQAAHASEACANGGCEGTLCRYMPGYSCSFPDRYSCTTHRCAFILQE
jgi:hypothetical protein